MSDTTSDVSNRLSINVPDLDTRLNMGTPDPGAPSGSAPFGYTGFGIHTNFNWFIDVGRVGLYQSNLTSCWQVGGKWLQWSNQDMYMASMGNTLVGADTKVVIAAGAGQGQVTALTAGGGPFDTPRPVEYNNLQLHWRVDGVQVALKQFFYGYGQTKDGTRLGASIFGGGKILRTGDPGGSTGKGWRETSATTKDAQSHFSDADSGDSPVASKHYPGGFLKDVDDLLTSIDGQSLKNGLLRAFEWEGDRYDMTNIFGKQSSYFPTLETLDPYPPTAFTGPMSKIYAGMVQALNNSHRTVDMLRRLAAATTDNPIGKRVQALVAPWHDVQPIITSAMNQYSSFHDPTTAESRGGQAMPGATPDAANPWTRSGGEIPTIASHAPGNVPKDQNTGGGSAGEWWDNERSIDSGIGSWPEDLRDQFRPVWNAASDLSSMFDSLSNVITDAMSVGIGQLQAPSLLGLVGKDGITLGTNGPMYGAGGGISFIATGKPTDDNPIESDRDKYIPGEQFVNWAVDGDDPAKSIQQAFIPDSAVKKAMRGSFRVAAEQDVVVTAAGKVMQAALGETTIVGKKRISVASNDVVSVRSFTKYVEVLGAEVRVGAFGYKDATKYGGQQQVTTKVNVAATKRLDLRTADMRIYMDANLDADVLPGGSILIGANDKDKAFVKLDAPHIAIDGSFGGSIMAGLWSGSDFMGLSVDAVTNIACLTGEAVAMGVKSGPGIEIGKENGVVRVRGTLKVGSAFSVTDSGTYSPSYEVKPTPPASPTPQTDSTQVGMTYAMNAAQAQVAKESVDAPDPPRPPGMSDADFQKAKDGETAASRNQLRSLYGPHVDALEQAKAGELTPSDIGWKPVHEDYFSARAPDDAGGGSSGS